MIIDIDDAGARLAEADDFKTLKVRCHIDPGRIERILPEARRDGDHIWIAPAWLAGEGRGTDPEWMDKFAKMLAYAAKSGWMDDGGAVRVHIERVERP